MSKRLGLFLPFLLGGDPCRGKGKGTTEEEPGDCSVTESLWTGDGLGTRPHQAVSKDGGADLACVEGSRGKKDLTVLASGIGPGQAVETARSPAVFPNLEILLMHAATSGFGCPERLGFLLD